MLGGFVGVHCFFFLGGGGLVVVVVFVVSCFSSYCCGCFPCLVVVVFFGLLLSCSLFFCFFFSLLLLLLLLLFFCFCFLLVTAHPKKNKTKICFPVLWGAPFPFFPFLFLSSYFSLSLIFFFPFLLESLDVLYMAAVRQPDDIR